MEASIGNVNTQPAAAPAQASAVHVDHWCEHPACKAWGSFGRPGPTGLTVWKCYRHDPVYGASE